MAEVVRPFRDRHPRVELHFRDAEPYEHVPQLEALKCDCVVMLDLDGWPSARSYGGNLVSEKGDVVYEPLSTTRSGSRYPPIIH